MTSVVATPDGPALRVGARPRLQHAGDVRVRVELAGICRTDVIASRCGLGCRPGRVLGHEFAGTVIEIGAAVTHLASGQAVTATPYFTCGRCRDCQLTEGRLCQASSFLGVDRDGAFAEQVVIPGGAVRPLPPAMSWRHGAYVEPVAASLAVMNAQLPPDRHGLIYGHGRIAELTQRVLAVHGFTQVDRCAALADLPSGRRYAYVIETTAAADGIADLLYAVEPGGRVVLKSRPAAPVSFDLALAVQREITFHAVHYGDFDEAIRLLATGALDVDDLLGETYPLAAFEAAFAADTGARKIFLAPHGATVS